MLIINKFKLVLSKIRVAQCNKKKTLKLKIFSVDLFLLDILWKNGFIYGYNKIKDSYLIFLKYNLQGLGILDSIVFLESKLTNKELKTLITLDSHYSYLVWNCKGISVYSTSDMQNGGWIIAKC